MRNPNYNPNDPYYPNRPKRLPNPPTPPVGVWQWIGTFIISAIPIVNIIALFVWAFSAMTNPSKRNYARAILLLMVFSIVLSVIAVCIMVFVLQLSFSDIPGLNDFTSFNNILLR